MEFRCARILLVSHWVWGLIHPRPSSRPKARVAKRGLFLCTADLYHAGPRPPGLAGLLPNSCHRRQPRACQRPGQAARRVPPRSVPVRSDHDLDLRRDRVHGPHRERRRFPRREPRRIARASEVAAMQPPSEPCCLTPSVLNGGLACSSGRWGSACGGVNQNEVTPNSTPTAISQWYEGGTLHGATIADWKSATARNRLATSADFVMVSGQYQSLPPDLRDRAVQFEECISTATQGVAAVDTSLVSEIAAACGLLLQYR